MLKYGLIVFLIVGLMISLRSQQPGTGLLFEDESYDEVARQPDYGQKGGADTIFKIDLKPFCPKPINQGPFSTCTGWSVGYASHTIQHAILNDWEGQTDKITENAFSAFFLYNQIKESPGCAEGTYITKALELMRDKGNVFSKSFDEAGCEKLPEAGDLLIAQKYRINDFRRLFDRESPPREKITAVKQSLIDQKPVVIGMQLKQNFLDLRGQEWWFPDLGNSPILPMGHAMSVIGFDDGKGNAGGAFQIMNSWGPTWGDGGFIWVNYDDFAKYCKYGFQFSVAPTEIQKVDLVGKVNCRFAKVVGEEVSFSNVKATLKGNTYALSGRTWKKDDIFQLQVYDVTAERFMYAFSYDPDGNINLHWPRDGKLDNKFQGRHESSVIISRDIFLTLPEESTAIELLKPGLEQICFLFSPTPIPDLNEKLKKIQNQGANLSKAVYDTFGDQLLLPEKIAYTPQYMGYWASKRYSDKIVPVFMQIKVE
ncbi:MAG: C1 family peptidase [Bacteroidia bacterium]|nr:C1 family peptidase [Bacteroidia bacterium]